MRRALVIVFSVLALSVAAFAPAAVAVDPFTADGIVSDTTGTLSGSDVTAIEAAVDELRSEDGVTLYVTVVDRFTNPSDGLDWATAFAERNQLVSTDVILYIGLSSLEAGLNVASDLDISDAQIASIENRQIIPELDSGDVRGAAIGAADGLRSALGGDAATAESGSSSDSSPSSSSGIGGFVTILVLLGLIGAGLAIWFLVRHSRENKKRRQQLQAREQSLAELGKQAAVQLVQADDLVKSAEQEAGFAEAQFGADAAAPFLAAVRLARTKTTEAFAIQGRLLDHEPDSEQQRFEWNQQILALTAEAQQRIAAETARFEQLRDIGRNAPELLRQVTGAAERLTGQLHAATTSLDALRSRYAPTALRTVDDAASQAQRLLQLAISEAEQAGADLRQGQPNAAAVDIGDAQAALAQAGELLGSIERTRSDLERAGELIQAELADLQADIARLRAPVQPLGEAVEAQNAAAIAQATAAIQQAASGAQQSDPLALLQLLRQANGGLDAALAATSSEQQRLDTIRRRLQRALEQARAQVRAGTDYIATHRGAVSATPRTRIAQAETELARAEQLAPTAPDAALAAATQAITLSDQAISIATGEVQRQQAAASSGAAYSGYGATYSAPRGGSDLGEAIIGGIIGGILSSGGSSRGGGFRGSSGGFGGSPGGGFRGSSGSRGSSGGGFRATGGFRSSGGGFRSGGGGRRR